MAREALKPTLIFVVDDEPLLLDLAAIIINPMGFEVRTFRDPEVALREYINEPPDLIITDYAMGRMSGMDLIRECRRINPDQKILLISGTVDEHAFAESAIRPNRFMAKPYQFVEFSNCIHELLAAE
ncbi:MAG TPA: response regulator [Verrucomicrobiae bacterium]|jgi:DNA-binding NtrC family response regulator